MATPAPSLELSVEQADAVRELGEAIVHVQTALAATVEFGVEVRDALDELGILAELPPAIRLML